PLSGRRPHESLDLLREARASGRGRIGDRPPGEPLFPAPRDRHGPRFPEGTRIQAGPPPPPQLPHSAAWALPLAVPQLGRGNRVTAMKSRKRFASWLSATLIGTLAVAAAPLLFGGGGDEGVDILPLKGELTLQS